MAAMIGGSMVETLTHAPEETEALAAELARRLGVGERVTSPTYTIGHRYHGDGVAISHLDLYRFESVSPAEWGDLEPYFEQAIAFVEWPEAGEGVLPPPRYAVRLRHAGGGRAVEIEEC